MKQSDIKKLEKVVELYKKIEALLDQVSESAYIQPTEYFNKSGATVYSITYSMYKEARLNRMYIEGKIKAFRELKIEN